MQQSSLIRLKNLSFLVTLMLLAPLGVQAQQTCANIWHFSGLQSDLLKNPPATEAVGFIVPNETQPRLLRSALSASQTGVYLSVGTERGFMSAAMTEGRTQALVLIDRDANVVAFNQVNKALLALSTSRADYLELRLAADFETWSQRAGQMSQRKKAALSSEDAATLQNPKFWSWWKKNVRELSAWEAFHREGKSGQRQGQNQPYSEVNYLFEDILYQRIATLAKAGRVIVYHENLGSPEVLLRLKELTEGLKTKMSVVDLSNSWQQGYLGHENTNKFLQSILDLQSSESKLVLSYMKIRNPSANQSEFEYSVIPLRSSVSQPGYLSLHMGALARQEPSQSYQYRGRHSRFDSDGF